MDKNNIILIGMPSCGKTTIGKLLSTYVQKDFVDTDNLLEKSTKLSPREIVTLYGEEFFLKIQERIVVSMNFSNTVISTGGSVVYSKKLMNKFSNCGHIIYLKNSVHELAKRFANDRRIIGSNNQNFEDLYKQRDKLYTKYAHKILDCSKYDDIMDIVERIKMEVI